MKGLAEFVMQSRLRALLVAVAGAGSLLFCWISAAVVALVTLRQGPRDGAWVLMWAVLPAGALALAYGDGSALALLLGAAVLALILRSTVSLALTVLASVAVGAVTGLAMLLLGGEMLAQIAEAFGEFLAGMEQQLSVEGAEPVVLMRPTAGQIAGMFGTGNAVLALLCVLLARYWQAALYNPGGFGQEFRALRLSSAVATGLAVAGLGLAATGPEYRTWAMLLLVPLSVSGLALVHARANWRGQGAGWLTGFYVVWVFFDPVKLLVVGFALADSWLDFRGRWLAGSGRDGDGDSE